MADFCGFQLLRLLRSSTFLSDNGTRERDALAAFGLETERAIGLAGADRASTRGAAHFAFLDCIANADDHRDPHSVDSNYV
jgi:hypothetical protein